MFKIVDFSETTQNQTMPKHLAKQSNQTSEPRFLSISF